MGGKVYTAAMTKDQELIRHLQQRVGGWNPNKKCNYHKANSYRSLIFTGVLENPHARHTGGKATPAAPTSVRSCPPPHPPRGRPRRLGARRAPLPPGSSRTPASPTARSRCSERRGPPRC